MHLNKEERIKREQNRSNRSRDPATLIQKRPKIGPRQATSGHVNPGNSRFGGKVGVLDGLGVCGGWCVLLLCWWFECGG